jgi:hypothetical protein
VNCVATGCSHRASVTQSPETAIPGKKTSKQPSPRDKI